MHQHRPRVEMPKGTYLLLIAGLLLTPTISWADGGVKQIELPTVSSFQNKPSTQAYDELLRDYRKNHDFRLGIASKLFAIRATTPPPPPFDPQIPKVEHGVAIEVAHLMGFVWATSANLVEGAAKVEIKDQHGIWHPVGVRLNCENANLAILTDLPKHFSSSAETSKRRAFDVVNPDSLLKYLPVLAVTDIEASSPTLHLGLLMQNIQTEIGQTWEHNLLISPGTPLMDNQGRVVLIQISPSHRKIATSPLDGFRCAPKSSTNKNDE